MTHEGDGDTNHSWANTNEHKKETMETGDHRKNICRPDYKSAREESWRTDETCSHSDTSEAIRYECVKN